MAFVQEHQTTRERCIWKEKRICSHNLQALFIPIISSIRISLSCTLKMQSTIFFAKIANFFCLLPEIMGTKFNPARAGFKCLIHQQGSAMKQCIDLFSFSPHHSLLFDNEPFQMQNSQRNTSILCWSQTIFRNYFFEGCVVRHTAVS